MMGEITAADVPVHITWIDPRRGPLTVRAGHGVVVHRLGSFLFDAENALRPVEYAASVFVSWFRDQLGEALKLETKS